jgi:hypothetical protein
MEQQVIIIETDEYKITRNKKDRNIFNIFFYDNREKLIKSFIKTKIITGASITNDYTLVSFNASTIKTLNQYQEELNDSIKTKEIPYSTLLKMTYQLSNQLKYIIENFKQTFIGYNKENVIVIDDSNFLYLPSHSELYQINSDNNILITTPFYSKDFYLSPEMYIIKEIPSYIHYKCVYYSLGCLLIDCLLEEEIKEQNIITNTINNPINILDKLSIKETKLYYFIKRTLLEEARNRCLLYI